MRQQVKKTSLKYYNTQLWGRINQKSQISNVQLKEIIMKDEFLDKCIAFSVKINKLRKYLREKQHEYNNSDQIQRSGTSIGANYSEACDAESKADFIHKLGIAQKEANETIYWLKVLYGSELITKTQYDELLNDARELYRIIAASLKTLKMGNDKWEMTNGK